MQKVCLGNGSDVNGVAAYPFGAALGKEFLLQRMVGDETLFGHVERLWLCTARVDVFYRGGITEEKAHFINSVQSVLQLCVAIDAEIGRYEAESLGALQILSQVIGDGVGPII